MKRREGSRAGCLRKIVIIKTNIYKFRRHLLKYHEQRIHLATPSFTACRGVPRSGVLRGRHKLGRVVLTEGQ